MVGFEITMEIQESILEEILRAQYAAGAMQHKRLVLDGRRQASPRLGRPRLFANSELRL